MRFVLEPASLTFLNVAGKEDHDGMEVRSGEATHPVIRMAGAGGAEMAARAAIPWRNSPGKVASEDSSTPSARKPFHVKPMLSHRVYDSLALKLSAVPTFSRSPLATHGRLRGAERRGIYRATSARGRLIRKC